MSMGAVGTEPIKIHDIMTEKKGSSACEKERSE